MTIRIYNRGDMMEAEPQHPIYFCTLYGLPDSKKVLICTEKRGYLTPIVLGQWVCPDLNHEIS